ncbi:DNA helicase loader [Kosakonia phage Kc304]|uniref:Loader of DNA helicase n=2 Tax=Winklervirus chi14 TaxID=2560752 RepID=A0A1Z1LYP1_9CAUD|nr:DNA helicase loader [Serratia phage CHI14]ARW57668.1 loader of DNA helicase [Serratia phage CHI14]ARW57943.1 loader of DNA helicase [Serratia phage CBH8]QYN80688.1 DNA helicase loader [Kosakonia phage Kc304]UYM28896.1 loader of DNA helicase [Serratia phage vB_SspM_LC53]
MITIRMPPNGTRFINGKSVYQLYLMLKNHFNGRYDVIKYNWTMRISDAAYNKRRDKYFFEKLADKHNLKELTLIFMSNLVANQDAWIGDISDADALVFYREYIGKLKRVKTVFEDDIKNMYYFAKKVETKSLNELFEYNKNVSSSYIFKLLQSNVISFETFILLDSFLNIIDKHDELSTDLVWSNYSVKLKAYKKILNIDALEAKKLFIQTIKACKI